MSARARSPWVRTLALRVATSAVLPSLAGLAALAAAAWVVVSLGQVVVARLVFPGEIEWTEGQCLEEAWRVLGSSASIYGDPSMGPTQTDMPLYYAIVGALGRLTGLGYPIARFVSLGATLTVFGLAYRVVAAHARQRRRGAILGAVAVGAIAAGYPLGHGFYDLARVEALGLALLLGSAVALTASPRRRARPVLAAILITAALYTKATCIVFAPWLAVYALACNLRRGLQFVLVAVLASTVCFGALQLASDGWFSFWVSLPTLNDFDVYRVGGAEVALLRFAPHAFGTILLGTFLIGRRWASSATIFWWGLLTLALPTGLVALARLGGSYGDLLPTLAIAPVATLLAAEDLLSTVSRDRPWRGLALATGLGAAALYLAVHRVPARFDVPAASELRQARALEDFVADLPGRVTIPSQPFLARKKNPAAAQILGIGYAELFWGHEPAAANMVADLWRADSDWVVLTDQEEIGDALWSSYRLWCRLDPPYSPGHVDDPSEPYVRAMAPHLVYRALHGAPRQAPFESLVRTQACDRPASRARVTCALGGGFALPADDSGVLRTGPKSRLVVVADQAGEVEVALHVQALGVPGDEVIVRVGDRRVPVDPPKPGADLVIAFPASAGDNLVTVESPDPGATSKDPRPPALVITRVTCRAGDEHHVVFP